MNDIANVPAYMAIQFKGMTGAALNEGWLPTGQGLVYPQLPVSVANPNASPPVKADPALGPPDTACYGELRKFNAGVSRSFEGINSSGGPQTAFRADHADLSVERATDAISPYLFEYCATGKQLAWVHVVRLLANADDPNLTVELHIRLQDVQVTSFAFASSIVWWDERIESTMQGGTVTSWSAYEASTNQIDRVTFLYTTRYVAVNAYTTPATTPARIDRGWNTGSDSLTP